MLRKTIIALTAIAALGGVALAPTVASAGWKGNGHHHRHHHHRHGFGWGFYAGPRYVPTDCYWVKKQTPIGVKLVRVCSAV
jgi:hypothetical protein